MRTLLLLFALCGSALAAELRTNVIVEIDYPPEEMPGTTFILRCTTNPASGPCTNWPIIATWSGTTQHALPIVPGAYSMVCQASNLWRLSDPSNVATTPAPPRSDVNLRIR